MKVNGASRVVIHDETTTTWDVVDTMRNEGSSIGTAATTYEECTRFSKGFTYVSVEHNLAGGCRFGAQEHLLP